MRHSIWLELGLDPNPNPLSSSKLVSLSRRCSAFAVSNCCATQEGSTHQESKPFNLRVNSNIRLSFSS